MSLGHAKKMILLRRVKPVISPFYYVLKRLSFDCLEIMGFRILHSLRLHVRIGCCVHTFTLLSLESYLLVLRSLQGNCCRLCKCKLKQDVFPVLIRVGWILCSRNVIWNSVICDMQYCFWLNFASISCWLPFMLVALSHVHCAYIEVRGNWIDWNSIVHFGHPSILL